MIMNKAAAIVDIVFFITKYFLVVINSCYFLFDTSKVGGMLR